MAINAYLNADEVVANALTIIPEATQKDKNIFKQWVFLAERQIGSSPVSVKNETNIVAHNFRLGKPIDCVKSMQLALFDKNDNEVKYRHHGRGMQVADRDILEGDNRDVIVMETDDAFYLSSNATNVTNANLRYYGFPIDENDNLKIPEIHVLAIMSFIKYMMAMKSSERRLDIKDYYGIWEAEKRAARARTMMPSELEARDISKRFMSMIDYFNKDY